MENYILICKIKINRVMGLDRKRVGLGGMKRVEGWGVIVRRESVCGLWGEGVEII